ncbi:MAG: lipoate--protein ligase family protein [Chloroflexi bacterium]|nr:lipoate--protein ligase family protein [Chloroflexota bacterium]MBU1751267.1 lipoate--protein ligase family protein [Chloroflexota bacterium]
MTTAWRLLSSGPADGPTNMAVDEALMEGQSPPTLRFYGWEPPCVSLGRFQPVDGAVDRAACQSRGIDLVRRLTGGRAILHDAPDRELTYSLVVPAQDALAAGDVLSSYRAISAALVAGLRRLGVPAAVTPARTLGPDPATAACFDQPADYEITVHGRKLVGSAQARRGGVILQHGTVLLDADLATWAAVLCPPAHLDTAAFQAYLTRRIITLRQAAGRPVSFGEAQAALVAGFAALGMTLTPGELTDHERQQADRLCQTQYATESWTHRH